MRALDRKGSVVVEEVWPEVTMRAWMRSVEVREVAARRREKNCDCV